MPIPSIGESLPRATKEKAMASWSIGKTEFMKDSGSMTKGNKRDMKGTAMATGMKATLRMEKHMEKVCTTGPMVRSMTESGAEESKKATACGEVSSETAIWANGKTVKLMVTESISGKMVIGMKAPGQIASSMAKALTSSRTAMSTRVTTCKESPRVKESINGRTAVSTRASSKTE